jgi:hypothetical protein
LFEFEVFHVGVIADVPIQTNDWCVVVKGREAKQVLPVAP